MRIKTHEEHILIPIWLARNDGAAYHMEEVENWLARSGKWELVDDEEECADEVPWRALHLHQAKAYFHPFVRRFLFGPKAVRRLRQMDVRRFELQARKDEEVIRFNVPVCELWLFAETEIAVLHVGLQLDREDGDPLDLDRALDARDMMRRIYPPYFDRSHHGGHCPWSAAFVFSDGSRVESDFGNVRRFSEEWDAWLRADHDGSGSFGWASHWQCLLEPLDTLPPGGSTTARGPWYAIQLGDDRGAIASRIGFGDTVALRQLGRGDWIRLCFADSHGTDELPYARKFLDDFEERYCYDRYWYEAGETQDAPSRMMNCGYAFTWVGSAGDGSFFADEKCGAPVIFRDLYVRMAVIAHFQRAALLATSAKLSAFKGEESQGGEIAMADVYRQFIRFTQRYWFDEISPQQQGFEMFERWRRELRLQELFDEVRQELRDITEWTDSRKQLHLNATATRLSQVAIPIAGFSVAVGVIAMLAGILGANSIAFPESVQLSILGWLPAATWKWITSTVVILGIAVVGAAAIWFLKNRSLVWSPDSESSLKQPDIEAK